MKNLSESIPAWLGAWMADKDIDLWGAADLSGFSTPRDENGRSFSFALSWVIPMDPRIMASINNGPNRSYADEYGRVNDLINEQSQELVLLIRSMGFGAASLAASERTDPVHMKGDFPHKTAATRAGLGWIGRHCQLITRPYGPWVRLGTVFTHMALVCGDPIEGSFCGGCLSCVDACPADALSGHAWDVSVPRGEILHAQKCDDYKKEHFFQFHGGHNCNICSAVCPHGLKALKLNR